MIVRQVHYRAASSTAAALLIQHTTAAMLNASRPTQRLSHAFFDCLCNDSTGALSTAATATATAATAAHNGTATSASDSQVHENGERDLFALIVVNGEVGEFLAPLWRHGQLAPATSQQPTLCSPPTCPPVQPHRPLCFDHLIPSLPAWRVVRVCVCVCVSCSSYLR